MSDGQARLSFEDIKVARGLIGPKAQPSSLHIVVSAVAYDIGTRYVAGAIYLVWLKVHEKEMFEQDKEGFLVTRLAVLAERLARDDQEGGFESIGLRVPGELKTETDDGILY